MVLVGSPEQGSGPVWCFQYLASVQGLLLARGRSGSQAVYAVPHRPEVLHIVKGRMQVLDAPQRQDCTTDRMV